MLELAGEPTAPTPWMETAAGHVADWRLEYAPLLESNQVPMRPERLCGELTELVPDDGIVVVDTGHAGMWMGGMYDMRASTQSYLRSAGHLGWAFPASLGAKCAQPDRPVVCFTGDSGFWYHVAEIETAVRWGINTITVVNNNHSGNQSKRGFDRVYGGKQSEKAREMWVFTEVDFAALAEHIGAVGIRVEKPSDLASAFDRALSADRPVVLDVVTDIDALAPPAVE
jgi:acetolactate synthase-1/2/3 large subunit